MATSEVRRRRTELVDPSPIDWPVPKGRRLRRRSIEDEAMIQCRLTRPKRPFLRPSGARKTNVPESTGFARPHEADSLHPWLQSVAPAGAEERMAAKMWVTTSTSVRGDGRTVLDECRRYDTCPCLTVACSYLDPLPLYLEGAHSSVRFVPSRWDSRRDSNVPIPALKSGARGTSCAFGTTYGTWREEGSLSCSFST